MSTLCSGELKKHSRQHFCSYKISLQNQLPLTLYLARSLHEQMKCICIIKQTCFHEMYPYHKMGINMRKSVMGFVTK